MPTIDDIIKIISNELNNEDFINKVANKIFNSFITETKQLLVAIIAITSTLLLIMFLSFIIIFRQKRRQKKLINKIDNLENEVIKLNNHIGELTRVTNENNKYVISKIIDNLGI